MNVVEMARRFRVAAVWPRSVRSAALRALVLVALGAPALEAGAEEPPHPVRWREEWPRFRPWEYAGTAALMSASFAMRFAGPPPPDNWRGGLLFDDAVLRAVAIEDAGAAEGVAHATDVLFYGSMLYRLVDSTAVPLLGYGDPDLALQMSMIDLSAFSVQAIVLWGSQTLIGRTRPIVLRCANQGEEAEERCSVPTRLGTRRSFIAGHAATGMTSAGLTCLHHSRIPLYGGWGDSAACAATLVAAVASGYGRVATELHYPTDLLLGFALGAVSGWVLPAALHYGFSAPPPDTKPPDAEGSRRARGARMAVLPLMHQSQLGAMIVGSF